MINCAHDALVSINELKPNPKNPNKHSQDQIERLAKIIAYQGQRSPVVVSNQTGFIVVGHGRMAAMKYLGWEKVAVNFQDFENEEQEYAHLVADNSIAEWAELDLSKINIDMIDLGPDFDIDLLGIENFQIDVSEKEKKENTTYKIEVLFPNEIERDDIFKEMLDRNYIAKVL
jgi:ParB-like chromosome segregation protein Spo0J